MPDSVFSRIVGGASRFVRDRRILRDGRASASWAKGAAGVSGRVARVRESSNSESSVACRPVKDQAPLDGGIRGRLRQRPLQDEGRGVAVAVLARRVKRVGSGLLQKPARHHGRIAEGRLQSLDLQGQGVRDAGSERRRGARPGPSADLNLRGKTRIMKKREKNESRRPSERPRWDGWR